MRAIIAALALGLGFGSVAPQTAHADTALLIVNDRYGAGQNLRQGRTVERLRGPLERNGFDVIVASDANGAALRDAFDALLDAGEDERIVIVAVGHYAQSRSDNFLLATDARAPSLADVGAVGVSLSALMETALAAPGRAYVLLGWENRRMDVGLGLRPGVGRLDVPNGVTVVTGAPEALADFTRSSLLRPGSDIASALANTTGLRSFGFVPSGVPFLPVANVRPQPDPIPQVQPPAPLQPTAPDAALWNAASELNNAAAYRAYLDRFPNGFYAEEAWERIRGIENDPIAQAQAAEDALGLDQLRRIHAQQALSILGYYDLTIDGLFGAGTRAAISDWQRASGLPISGYFNDPQLARLSQEAAARQAQIEAEEQAAQAEAERVDRAYWQVTGQGANEAGIRDYLERFPTGLFADEANQRLRQFDDVAWNNALAADTVAAFRGYLNAYPEGAHANDAQTRIQQLTGTATGPAPGNGGLTPAQIDVLARREASLNLPPVTRSILEQRLLASGQNPGRIDGRFDAQTRQAIRRYQQSRNLPVTGYFDQPTVGRLLGDAFGGVIRLNGGN